MPKLLFNGRHGLDKTRIIGGQKAYIVKQEEAGVERFSVKRGGKSLFFFAPGAPANRGMDLIGLASPISGAIRKPDIKCDSGQAITGRPAHHTGKSMNAYDASRFPWSGIRLIMNGYSRFTQRLQSCEESNTSTVREPTVKENMSYSQNGRTVNVMLNLLAGLISCPDRTHSPVAGQIDDFTLI